MHIHLGKSIPLDPEPIDVFFDDSELEPYRHMPWFKHYIKRRYPLVDLDFPQEQPVDVGVDAQVFYQHGLVVGPTGFGKTRLLLKILSGLVQSGCSVVMIDPKPETIREAVTICRGLGMSNAHIDCLLPEQDEVSHSFNIMDFTGRELEVAADAFVEMLGAVYKFGDNMDHILKSAFIVVGAQGLTMIELNEFLTNDKFREAVLARARNTPAYQTFDVQHRFFEGFGQRSDSRRETALAPLTKVLDVFVSNHYFKSMFSGTEDTIRIKELWKEQRFVGLNITEALNTNGQKIMAGMFINYLFRTAKREGIKGSRPVVLWLDEVGLQVAKTGEQSLSNILAFARSYNLRVLAATQHLENKIPAELRSSFITNAAFQAYFKAPEDAVKLSALLNVDKEERAKRVVISATKDTFNVTIVLQDKGGSNWSAVSPIAAQQYRTAESWLGAYETTVEEEAKKEAWLGKWWSDNQSDKWWEPGSVKKREHVWSDPTEDSWEMQEFNKDRKEWEKTLQTPSRFASFIPNDYRWDEYRNWREAYDELLLRTKYDPNTQPPFALYWQWLEGSESLTSQVFRTFTTRDLEKLSDAPATFRFTCPKPSVKVEKTVGVSERRARLLDELRTMPKFQAIIVSPGHPTRMVAIEEFKELPLANLPSKDWSDQDLHRYEYRRKVIDQIIGNPVLTVHRDSNQQEPGRMPEVERKRQQPVTEQARRLIKRDKQASREWISEIMEENKRQTPGPAQQLKVELDRSGQPDPPVAVQSSVVETTPDAPEPTVGLTAEKKPELEKSAEELLKELADEEGIL